MKNFWDCKIDSEKKHQDKCEYCDGPNGTVWVRKHRRSNGIVSESGWMLCKKCGDDKEVDQWMQEKFQKSWNEQVALARSNYEKYGLYTNVRGKGELPSKAFSRIPPDDDKTLMY